MKQLTHLLRLIFCVCFVILCLMPADALATWGQDNPFVKQVEITRIDHGHQGRSTIIKVVLIPGSTALEYPFDVLELRDADGSVFSFTPDEFHAADAGDYFLKVLPFYLSDNKISLTMHDREGIKSEFPTRQLSATTATIDRASSGDWTGTTSQAGGYVNFTVSGSNVVNFEIRMTVCGTGCTWIISSVFTIPISGDSFSYDSASLDITGTFTSETTATGTWDYHDIVFGGFGNGTWQAATGEADPSITLTPSSHDYGDQQVNTTSGSFSFELRNTGGGTATGSVDVTATNADQFEISSGGDSFSLTHDQTKTIDVRFVPTSAGSKTATLMANGYSPCNDDTSSLSGAGVAEAPILSVVPDYRSLPAGSGLTTFAVANTGAGTMTWTAEVDPLVSWATVVEGGSGTDSGTITVDYEANTGEARTGSVIVTADGAVNSPKTVELLQSGSNPVGETKLLSSDGADSDRFGYSVSMSGDYAIVGAYGDEESGASTGSAYIFEREELHWVQRAKLTASDGSDADRFGYSVCLSGDYAIVGAYRDDDHGTDSGSAYIFEKPPGGWSDMTQTEKLTASDGAVFDYFGQAVAISGSCAVVGAKGVDGADYNSGAAYVFEREVGGWSQQARLEASDADEYDYFGASVSMSGDCIIVGAFQQVSDTIGSAYIFDKPPGGWGDMTETAMLTTSDSSETQGFGMAVAISEAFAMVGARYDDDNGSASGSTYIYERPPAGWTSMSETAKLIADDGEIVDHFGTAVSLSGDLALVGARLDDDNGSNAGSAYLFRHIGSTWVLETKLTPVDGAAGDELGGCVSIDGGMMAIGASKDDDNGDDSGSAYVFIMSPTIEGITFDACIPELGTSAIGVSAHDLAGGDLTYTWEALESGNIIGQGAEAVFDPPDSGPHACPYQIMVTATSDATGLSASETIDIHVKASGDVTGDGVVNLSDLNQIRDHFMQSGDPGWIDADLDCDGWVNLEDLNLIRDSFMSFGGCSCQ